MLGLPSNGATMTGRDHTVDDATVVYGTAPVADVAIWMQLLNEDGSPNGAARFKGFYPINQKVTFPYTPESDGDVRLYAIPRAANGGVPSSALEDAASVFIDYNREISSGIVPVISLSGAASVTAATIAVANTSQYATTRRVKISASADMSNAATLTFTAAAGALASTFELARGNYPATVYVSVAHSSGGDFGSESNVLAVTFQAAASGLSIPLAVASTTLPVCTGVIVDDSPAFYNVSRFTLKNAIGTPVACNFEIISRWHGETSDVTKPVAVVLLNFTPNGSGNYTIDDSNTNPAPASPVALTNNANDFVVSTGNLAVTLPKTGTNLLNSFKLSTVEQLASTKPSLNAIFAAKSRLVANSTGVARNVAAAQGQNFVTVRNPKALTIGQSVKFSWTAKYLGFGSDFTGPYLRIEAETHIGVARGEFTTAQRLVFARGTGNQFVLTAYDEYYKAGGILYRATGDGFNTGTMPANVTVEDQDAIDAATYTISDIQGNRVYFSAPLSKRLLIGTEIIPVSLPSPLTATFKVQNATIPAQSAMHLIIKQDGWFELSSARVWQYLQGSIYWHFYAGQNFTRTRLMLKNQTSSIEQGVEVSDVSFDQLKLTIPLASAATASTDEITAHSGAGSASARVLAGTPNSTAVAGTFKHCFVDAVQNFPFKIVASGSQIDHWYLSAMASGFQHHIPAHRAKVWESLSGVNADTAAAIVHDAFVTLDRAYTNELAIYPALAGAKHTWTSGEVPSTRQLEAANIAERLFEVGYDYTKNDSSGAISPAEQLDLERWKLSNHLYPGGNNDNGIHFGWRWWGVTGEPLGGDNFTANRYRVGDAMLQNWLRTGDVKAYRLATIHAMHAATLGMIWSALPQNGNTAVSTEGGAEYEKTSSLGVQIFDSSITHDWRQLGGLYLLTGDLILLEALQKQRQRALVLNATGVGGYFAYNDFRAYGRLANKFLESYLVFGIASDLEKAAFHLRQLRELEQADGGRGWACTPAYRDTATSGVQLFNLHGYCWDALTDYLLVKRSVGTPDTDLEGYLYRGARFACFGDAQLVARGTNAPLRYNVISGADVEAAGACYNWHPNSTTAGKTFAPIDATINLHGLTLAAFWFKNAALKLMAEQVFEALCFYRDLGPGVVAYSARQAISFRNRYYFGTSLKVYFQMVQACMLYLWYLGKNAALTPPVLTTIAPTSGAASSAQTLTLTGSAFVAGAEVSIGGITGLIPSALSGTSITVTLPAASLPAGAHPVMVTNPNGGQSQLSTLTLT